VERRISGIFGAHGRYRSGHSARIRESALVGSAMTRAIVALSLLAYAASVLLA
jgi:hypothetical protein